MFSFENCVPYKQYLGKVISYKSYWYKINKIKSYIRLLSVITDNGDTYALLSLLSCVLRKTLLDCFVI